MTEQIAGLKKRQDRAKSRAPTVSSPVLQFSQSCYLLHPLPVLHLRSSPEMFWDDLATQSLIPLSSSRSTSSSGPIFTYPLYSTNIQTLLSLVNKISVKNRHCQMSSFMGVSHCNCSARKTVKNAAKITLLMSHLYCSMLLIVENCATRMQSFRSSSSTDGSR